MYVCMYVWMDGWMDGGMRSTYMSVSAWYVYIHMLIRTGWGLRCVYQAFKV